MAFPLADLFEKDQDSFAAFDTSLGDAAYLLVCFSASYCPSCETFMPKLEGGYQHALEAGKSCRVLLIGCDKTLEKFDNYRNKFPEFLSFSFDETQSLKQSLRDKWDIKTIPHVVVLDRLSAKVVQLNVRFEIEKDPHWSGLPWSGLGADEVAHLPTKTVVGSEEEHWSLGRRMWKTPRFYQLGHIVKSNGSTYMDENAVRARAGLLNFTSSVALLNALLWHNRTLVFVLWPLVSWDMLAAALFGLTPFSPYGMLGTVLAYVFGPAQPHWKPAAPKRFAWAIGFCLVNICFVGYMRQMRALSMLAVFACYVATWLESALGFCIGCWVWNRIVTPCSGRQACDECKV
jgi:thiol-disulfide isomerase/thioredoxin